MNDIIKRFINKNKVHDISKVNKIPSKSINDVLRPINILSNIFGLRICIFPQARPRPLFSFLYSLTICCLHYIGSFYRDKQVYCNKVSHLDRILCHATTFFKDLTLCLILITGLYQSESSRLCAKKINDIDKTLKALGSSASFNDVYKGTIIYATIVIFYFGILSAIIILRQVVQDEPTNKSLMVYYSMFLHIYGFIIEFLLVMEFVTLLRCIKSEFQTANELLADVDVLPIPSTELKLIELKKILSVDENKLFSNLPSLSQTQSQLQIASQKINQSRMLLRTIRQVHLELYKVSKSLSKIYGIQISLEMAMCVSLITYVIYRCYESYQSENFNDVYGMIYQFFIAIMLLLEYSSKIFIIDYICDKTTKQAEHTSEIIHTFYGQNMDLKIKEEVDIFSLQLMQCRTTYSAFGLYNLNCKHICSCIGIITTYIVIIIQVIDSIKYGS